MARRTQGRKPRLSEGPAIAPWLALAAAVHAGLFLGVLAPTRDAAPDARAPIDRVTDPIWLDLIVDSSDTPAAAADDAPSEPPSPSALAALARQTTPPRVPAMTARGLPKAGDVEPAPNDPASGPSAASESAAVSSASSASDARPEGAASAAGAEAVAPGTEESGARLSLRDLGVGRGNNPFIGSVSELPTERQLLNQRLRQSLRGELAQRDQARGLGPEGPAVRAVTEIVMASAAAPNTSALLRVRTNGAGAVTLVDVLDADRDGDEWRRIASELVRALAGKKLRVPAGANGVSFQLRVVSRVQLPSGADPGLGIDVLGIPLKKGDGERSAKLSILSPVIQEIEVPDSNGLRVPVVSFSLIAGRGDLADIGAVARRLVTAYLVAMDTDFIPESTTPSALPAAPSKATPSLPTPPAP